MTAILAVLATVVGGFLGGVGRWALSRRRGGRWGTWGANVIACVVMGAVVGTREPLALLWGTGVAGALSTWSTLARELGQNVRQRRWRTVVGYATATLLAGLAGIWLGGLLV